MAVPKNRACVTHTKVQRACTRVGEVGRRRKTLVECQDPAKSPMRGMMERSAVVVVLRDTVARRESRRRVSLLQCALSSVSSSSLLPGLHMCASPSSMRVSVRCDAKAAGGRLYRNRNHVNTDSFM